MPEQSFENHTQKVPVFLVVLILLLLAFLVAVYTFFRGMGHGEMMHNSLMFATLAISALLGFAQCRTMALKVQDRAIRAEENLRHYVMTGKLLDRRLTIKQIVAVRFASDDQFVGLARQAAESGMAPKDIKQAVKTWRADFDRA